MEPLRQCLRMTSYGQRDHSGTVWAVRQGDSARIGGRVLVGSLDPGQVPAAAATAFQGDPPLRGAHVA